MRNISQAALLTVEIPLASGDEQREVIRQDRALREASERLLVNTASLTQKSEALRRSLLAAAFSGRLTGVVGAHPQELLRV
jgi:type I restriction enzyme S subunit